MTWVYLNSFWFCSLLKVLATYLMWYLQENEPYLERITDNLNLQHVWEWAKVVRMIRWLNLTAVKRIVCCERSEMDVCIFLAIRAHARTQKLSKIAGIWIFPGYDTATCSPPLRHPADECITEIFRSFYLRFGELNISCLWDGPLCGSEES